MDFRLYYPKPRSVESAATEKYKQNRITFRPHFYFGETNQEIDFVFFLNGLPIVDLELKHEKNQTVHDAVAQFVARDHKRKIFQHPFLYLSPYDRRAGRDRPPPNRGLSLVQHRTIEHGNKPERVPSGVPIPGGPFEGSTSGATLVVSGLRSLPRGGGGQARKTGFDNPASLPPEPNGAQSRGGRGRALRRVGRDRTKVPHPSFGRQREDTLHLLARRQASQPVQDRYEREAGGLGLHPHGSQVPRHQHPRGHREVHALEGRGRTCSQGGRPTALHEGAQADHRHHSAEVCMGSGRD